MIRNAESVIGRQQFQIAVPDRDRPTPHRGCPENSAPIATPAAGDGKRRRRAVVDIGLVEALYVAGYQVKVAVPVDIAKGQRNRRVRIRRDVRTRNPRKGIGGSVVQVKTVARAGAQHIAIAGNHVQIAVAVDILDDNI